MYNIKHKAAILTKVSISFISLLCMVTQGHNFVLHLSDDQMDDGAFTKHAMEELTSLFPRVIVWKKSDNCSCQYKCGEVSLSCCSLAKELRRRFLSTMELADMEKALLMPWKHSLSKILWRGLSYGTNLNVIVHLESLIDSEHSTLTSKTGCAITLM